MGHVQEQQHREAEAEPQEGRLHSCTAPQAAGTELPPGVRGASGHFIQDRKPAKAIKRTRESAKKETAEKRSMCVFGFVTLRHDVIHSLDSCAGCLKQPFQARAAERWRQNGCVKGVPRWEKADRTGKRK